MTKKQIPENHVSNKKKNTYTVAFSSLMPYSAFCLCKKTPLAIIYKNGTQVQNNGGWMHATEFPNPLAGEMGTKHTMFQDILGEKISSTIIEYLDKSTNEPVALLFPHGLYIFDKFANDYMSHFNHATRRDLNRQINIRDQLFEQFAKQNQK